MSWHMNELKYAFGLGGMMSFYGIVGLIVVLMPEDTMGWNYKIATIGLVLLTLPFALIIMFVAARRSKKKARLEAEADAAAAASNGEQAPQQGHVHGRFHAVSPLRRCAAPIAPDRRRVVMARVVVANV